MKFPVSITGKAGKATRTLVAGAALAVAAGGLGVSAAYAAPVEGPASGSRRVVCERYQQCDWLYAGRFHRDGRPVYSECQGHSTLRHRFRGQ